MRRFLKGSWDEVVRIYRYGNWIERLMFPLTVISVLFVFGMFLVVFDIEAGTLRPLDAIVVEKKFDVEHNEWALLVNVDGVIRPVPCDKEHGEKMRVGDKVGLIQRQGMVFRSSMRAIGLSKK
jgi:hypothetical protein